MLTGTEWFALTLVALFLKMAFVAGLHGYVPTPDRRLTRVEDAELYGEE